jgi:hypothetical protein
LAEEGRHISLLRLELDCVGRRRCTTEEFAEGSRVLLEKLGVWCAEIELAAAKLTPDILAPAGVGLLAHLEAISQLQR